MPSVIEFVKELEEHDRSVESFHSDPMTEAMGAPVGDFQEGFDREERAILSNIVRTAEDGSDERKMALGRLEKWMP